MARAKVVVAEGGEHLDNVELEDLTGDEQDIVAAIGELEGGEDARWQVTRIAPVPQGKSGGYCETFASNEISKEMIRKTCGKGRYRVRGLRPNGTFLKQFTVEVANDLPLDAVIAQAPANASPTNFMEMMQLMDERRSKARNELLAICAPIIAAAIPSLFGNRNQGNSVQDAVTLAASLKQLNGDGNSNMQMMELMFKAMEFAKDSGGKGGGDSWIDIAKEAVGAVGPMLANKFGPTAPLQSVSQTQLSAPSADVFLRTQSGARLDAPQPVAQLQPPPQENADMGLLNLLPWAKQTLAYLTEKAKANKDAGLYADWLLDNGPPNTDLTPFIQYLAAANWWGVLQQFSPGVAPYEGWFSELRVCVIEAWNEQHAPAPVALPDNDSSLEEVEE